MTNPGPNSQAPRYVPAVPLDRVVRPFARFLLIESAGGVVLLVCTIVAMVLANSRWAGDFAGFWKTPVVLTLGVFTIAGDIGHLIVNDGLMTIFFFVVGLEIKREIVAGELRDPRKAALPVMAAVGGMIVPAGIFLALRFGKEGESGWGIPMATDIAFAVGFLTLLGKRVPLGLKIMLLSLAIADDIGAILVIAAFYSSGVDWNMLGLAAAGFLVIVILNQIGVRRVGVYVLVGLGIWVAVLKSGVHPTVAGVLLGLLTPASAWIGDKALYEVIGDAFRRLTDGTSDDDREWMAGQLSDAARESVSPLARLEHALHPWVAFVIMPIFALANAGVKSDPAGLTNGVAIAVALGLFIGKPLGILAFSWLAVRIGLAKLPTGVTWKAILGAGCLGGIGFTMSLFIASLALKGDSLEAGKIGTLVGSAVSAVFGLLILIIVLPRRSAAT